MLETIISSIVLGVTAGFCPLNLFFILPIFPKVIEDKSFLNAIYFSIGISTIFVPLGLLANLGISFILSSDTKLGFLFGGVLSIVIGLILLRLIKISYILSVKKDKKFYGSTPYTYGISFGLITIARAAPLLISLLSIVALEKNIVIGVISLLIYSFMVGAPLIIIASIFGLNKVEEFIKKYSKLLDKISGVLLILIGVYYIYLFIPK
ncbi:MAG: Cytochrome C biogenesis protein transmembrane region [Candidatus Methanofastidiosum methylothiophilum]|jgi:cytochrome c-type biogenesis protein|uniref:Cytochrome C biogenesis protein transmembrane region n=1 Tax=Candidatus Methanofastidiosum methylothiophilum TaxID=1705564 RepID=A0A150JAZ3_9EURY|nr:MAG: Cytochrome C biogenesis protein transmembrane region [Candidatus Methanofastidiosum methylthiophilus]